MVEIAISLAIIGVALVSIIGVLPIGMHTQRSNREETLINQDATVLLEAIRGGARGLDDLTNYVFAITNNWTFYPSSGNPSSGTYGYTFAAGDQGVRLTNGFNIVGLMSTPEYTTGHGGLPIPTLINGGLSNHVVAYVRSLSGPAVEKPPQDRGSIIAEDSFGYRLLCVNAPLAQDTNAAIRFDGATTNAFYRQMAANLRELRLTFYWPLLPNNSLPADVKHQSFRTLVPGKLTPYLSYSTNLYFYQSQNFTNAP